MRNRSSWIGPIAGPWVLALLCIPALAEVPPAEAPPQAAQAEAPPAEAPAAAEAAAAPAEVVDRLHESLLDAMKRAEVLGYAGRYEMLARC